MAAATVSSVTRDSLGSLTLFTVRFSSCADTDTYASGLGTNVVTAWASAETNEATAGDEGVNVSWSSGTFTLTLKTTGVVTLFILARV